MISGRYLDQWQLQDTSSDFHNELGKIFQRNRFFRQMRCYQEVPVKTLVPTYHDPRHAVDWYVRELDLVIELHGRQHYKATDFSGTQSLKTKKLKFRQQKQRDLDKKIAIEDAGYLYLAISYKLKGKLDAEFIKDFLASY